MAPSAVLSTQELIDDLINITEESEQRKSEEQKRLDQLTRELEEEYANDGEWLLEHVK